MVEVDSSGLPRNRPEGTLMEHVGFFSQGRGVGEELKLMDTGVIVAIERFGTGENPSKELFTRCNVYH